MWPLSNCTRVLTDMHSSLKQNSEALPISSEFSSLGFPYEDEINTPREGTVGARALAGRISWKLVLYVCQAALRSAHRPRQQGLS